MQLLKRLLQGPDCQVLKDAFEQSQHLLFDRQTSSSKALQIALAHALGYTSLVISADSERQSRLISELHFFCPESCIICLPGWETLPCEPPAPSADLTGLRMGALWQLLQKPNAAIVLVTTQSLQQRTVSPTYLAQASLELKKGTCIGIQAMAVKLQEMGYELVERVSEKGQFAKRQSVIDLFPPNALEPLRLEWWGDEIEDLRIFELSSQRSREAIHHFWLLPAQELPFINPQSSVLDYIGGPYSTFFDEIQAIEDHYVQIDAMPGSLHAGYVSFDQAIAPVRGSCVYMSQLAIDALSQKTIYQRSSQLKKIRFEIFGKEVEATYPSSNYLRLSERFIVPTDTGDPFFAPIQLALEEDFDVFILCASDAERSQAKAHLTPEQLDHPRLHLIDGYLSESLVLEPLRVILAPMAQFTQHLRLYRPRLRISHSQIDHDLLDLQMGDKVVHLHHGIGVYQGIEKRPDASGHDHEFLCVEYAAGSKIFVPIENAHLLTRYQSFSDESVELHHLGSTRWKKQWHSAEKAIEGYAKKLLDLYAARLIQESVHCPVADSSLMEQFEQDFAYELTEDQVKAIAAIKADLCARQPMDRLVCGDVGYGKTEVAMRAAFKIIADAQCQVAVLAPTTVLALQHYETFCERMAGFGVRVAVLSRFTKLAQRRQILQDLVDGKVDVLIGTHRLLSSDVHFHNLGLLIIDEEQRFGVKAKEHLKLMKKSVNCLTLSATPIPRTLHLSLMGGKQLSVIATPPHDRQPITTLVCPRSEETLRAALLRELGRGGQAFYVHNNISDLTGISTQIQKLLPQLRIGIVHGQMEPDDIESVFHDFKSHRIDLLVATTIVETGIDIPNANTLFIDHADDFGLSDLYQLRGRVGRWNRKAYAYLFYPPKKTLSSIAKKRLEAIQKASGYGGGMKVALQDLAIRGFGELIGEQQSGHVCSIGFSLYCRLLQRTMQKLQGHLLIDVEKVRIEHNLPIQIPQSYVESTALRLELYQRTAQLTEPHQLENLRKEIDDRFGPPPEPIDWLLALSRIRMQAATLGIDTLKLWIEPKGKTLELQFEKQLGGGRSQRLHIKSQVESSPKSITDYTLQLMTRQPQTSLNATSTPKPKIKIDIQNAKKKFGLG